MQGGQVEGLAIDKGLTVGDMKGTPVILDEMRKYVQFVRSVNQPRPRC